MTRWKIPFGAKVFDLPYPQLEYSGSMNSGKGNTMRKFLLASASIASLGLVVSMAQAADVVPEPVSTWTGFHIGVGGGAGYNFYDAESEASIVNAIQTGEDDFIVDPESPIFLGNSIKGDDLGAWYGFGTVEVGFDYQFRDSPIVVGLLANYDFNGNAEADAESSTFSQILGPTLSLDNRIQADLGDSWFLGGRLGFVVNDDTLIYALGGYTWIKGKVEADHELNIDGFELGGTHVDEKESVDGATVGGGIEHMITESLSLKVEYRHDFLDDIEFSKTTFFEDIDDAGDDIALVQDGKVDFSRDTVRAVLSWRWNPGM